MFDEKHNVKGDAGRRTDRMRSQHYRRRPRSLTPIPSDLSDPDEPPKSIPPGLGANDPKPGKGNSGGHKPPPPPQNKNKDFGEYPSDSSESDAVPRLSRTPRRGATPLEENPWLFTEAPEYEERERKGYSIEQKFKLADLPEWDGKDKTLIDWIFSGNELAAFGYGVWMDLGVSLPRKFTKNAKAWWQGLLPEEKRNFSRNWSNLRKGVCLQWMTHEWIAQEKIRTKNISFRKDAHHKETPMEYYHRKLRALRISFSSLDQMDMVHEILDNAPDSWQKYFTIKIRNLSDLRLSIKSNEHLFEKETEKSDQVDYLVREVEKLKGKTHSNFSTKANYGSTRNDSRSSKEFKAKTHAAETKKPIGYHKEFTKYPFEKRDDIETKKGLSPEKKGGRPCRFCGSKRHWDNECAHYGKSRKARVNLATADLDLLEAIDAYDNLQEEAQPSEEEPEESEEEKTSEESGNELSSD
jgi:hypothetical protein